MNKYIRYCTGCGLCKSVGKADLYLDEKGFLHPTTDAEISDICPASGIQCSSFDPKEIWGRNKGVYIGWTNDKALRKKASSGGITNSLLLA